MDISLLVILIVGGLGVLLSYMYVFLKLCPANYITHPFWFGIPPVIVRILCVFQIFAALGFLLSAVSWIHEPPKEGVMGRPWALLSTLLVFFLGSILWPFATHFKLSSLAVGSLVAVALSSIVLLAGSIEEQNPRWWIVLGWILFSIVTVLCDGILWNARYIKTLVS